MTAVLILVCGAPASGKTTLARRLAPDLRLPLLEKDTIKESLAGVFATPDREASRRIGAASFQVLYDLAFGMVTHGVDVMIEANLTMPYAVAALERIARVSRILIVQCEAERGTIERRYRERHALGERHPAHFDLEALPSLLAGLDDGRFDLTGLGYPAMVVRTDEQDRPVYDDIHAWIGRARGQLMSSGRASRESPDRP